MTSRLLSSLKKTGGRNSAGRITSFHRGGGAKRLYRQIDLKRTDASLGVVERIDYDPNRSSRIALVRWQEGVQHKKPSLKEGFTRPSHLLESTTVTATTTISSLCYLSNLCPNFSSSKGKGGSMVQNGSKASYVMVGVPDGVAKSAAFHTAASGEGNRMGLRDVFLSAFSKGDAASAFSFGSSPIIPRMAVAGAKSAYFVAKERGDAEGKDTFTLGEIGKWRADSAMWNHRIKRQGAISWHSSINDWKVNLGQFKASEKNDSKAEAGKGSRKNGNAKAADPSTPVSYIIASHKLKPGDLVMNYKASSKSSATPA